MSESDKKIIVEYDGVDDYMSIDGCYDEGGGGDEICDCEHTFETDLFDIDPERAQEVTYCTKCFFILRR